MGVTELLFNPRSGKPGLPSQQIFAFADHPETPIYISNDGGVSWQPLPGQPLQGYFAHHAVLTTTGILYITYTDAPGPNGVSAGAVWKLNTLTGQWTDISPIKTGQHGASGYAGLAVDYTHPDTLMVSTLDRWNPGDDIFRSTDGGTTWHALRAEQQLDDSLTPYMNFGGNKPSMGWWLGALAIDPFRPGSAMYGTGATIWATPDVDQSDLGKPTHWSIGANGIEETAVLALISPPTGAPLFSGLGDIGGYRHDDIHISPQSGMWTPHMYNCSDLAFAQNKPAIILRSGHGDNEVDADISYDDGHTWSGFGSQPNGTRGGGPIAISTEGNAIVWSARSAPVSVSLDHGTTWTPSAGAPPELELAADSVDDHVFYGLDKTGNSVYRSVDSGVTFTKVSSAAPRGDYKMIVTAPGHRGEIWIAGGSGLFHSTDGGAAFSKVSPLTGISGFGLGKAAAGANEPALYAAGTIGSLYALYRSTDSGATWVRINDDQHQFGNLAPVIGDPRIFGRVYFGTNGRGIHYADPAC